MEEEYVNQQQKNMYIEHVEAKKKSINYVWNKCHEMAGQEKLQFE